MSLSYPSSLKKRCSKNADSMLQIIEIGRWKLRQKAYKNIKILSRFFAFCLLSGFANFKCALALKGGCKINCLDITSHDFLENWRGKCYSYIWGNTGSVCLHCWLYCCYCNHHIHENTACIKKMRLLIEKM